METQILNDFFTRESSGLYLITIILLWSSSRVYNSSHSEERVVRAGSRPNLGSSLVTDLSDCWTSPYHPSERCKPLMRSIFSSFRVRTLSATFLISLQSFRGHLDLKLLGTEIFWGQQEFLITDHRWVVVVCGLSVITKGVQSWPRQ